MSIPSDLAMPCRSCFTLINRWYVSLWTQDLPIQRHLIKPLKKNTIRLRLFTGGQWQGEPEGPSKNVRVQNTLKKQVDSYFERHRNYPAGQVYVQDICLEETLGKPLHRHWQVMINGGTAADLLRSDMQEQLRIVRERLKIKYIRFWDIYSHEMLLDHPSKSRKL